MPRYHLATYGCKTNQYESAALRAALARRGWTETDDPAEADVLLVNTCAVTARASQDAARDWRRHRRKNPHAPVALTGCAVDLDEVWTRPAETAPDRFLRFRNRDKHRIPEALEAWRPSGTEGSGAAVAGREDAGDARFAFSVERFAGHTRAFLKIQDGCANACAYCAVPRARGRPASRAPEAVWAEAAAMTRNGHAEIALTGINIGDYDAGGGRNLAWLLRALATRTPGLARLRLGSVEPPALTAELVGVMRECPTICPHVHLPLQSGDDGVLAAMNRRYRVADFARAVDRLRDALDRPALTTDVIVGFPGEDEAAFGQTLAVCERLAFSRLHVFSYSPRPGTASADRPAPDAGTVAERRRRLMALGETLARTYAEGFAGERLTVMGETRAGAVAKGYSERYVPVRWPWTGALGVCVRVRAVAADGEGLRAEAVAD